MQCKSFNYINYINYINDKYKNITFIRYLSPRQK